jgi:hypothetical protein
MSQKWMHILTRYQVSATTRIRLPESMAQIKLARAREQTLWLYPLSDCLCQKLSRCRNSCSKVPRRSQLLPMDSLCFPSRRFPTDREETFLQAVNVLNVLVRTMFHHVIALVHTFGVLAIDYDVIITNNYPKMMLRHNVRRLSLTFFRCGLVCY